MAQCRKKKQKFQRVGKFQTRTGTLQPALRVRVGSRVEISNPHPPRRKPARQTHGYAQPVIIPKYTLTNNIPQLVRVSVVADGQCLLAAFLGASIS
jgi:hypothetical protein